MSLRENQADAKQTFGFLGSLTSKDPAKQDEEHEVRVCELYVDLLIKDVMSLRENQADAKQTFGFLGSLTSKNPAKQEEKHEVRVCECM